MTLAAYRQKRNFRSTPEPQGTTSAADGALSFVVQRHHASRLHYDFRLELGGVLKSWAVPKGPSLNPADRRLAMQVEDHPLAYASFRGEIPKGNYGAGRVDIWDRGTWQPVDDNGREISPRAAAKALEDGSLKIELKGRRLQGGFALVRMKGDDETAWLLLKHKDRYATANSYDSEDFATKAALAYTRRRKALRRGRGGKVTAVETAVPRKVSTPRSAKATRASASPALPAAMLKPMLAIPHDAPFDDPDWIFELKLDGYRAIADCRGGEVKLLSRTGLSFKTKFPAVHEALVEMNLDATLDGEIVALDEHGRPSFQGLQRYDSSKHTLCYYVFDCLRYKEHLILDEPLQERKEALREIIGLSSVVRFCDHVVGRGRELFTVIRERGLEGVIAKRADSPYHPGQRSREWLKIKNVLTDEAVIVGFTQPRGSRKNFGALVLAEREGDGWRYLGHTGTGFDEKSLSELHEKLLRLQVSESPFKEKVRLNAPVTWVKPKLVAQLKYTERTRDGALRHPVFLGLRTDKKAEEVMAPKAQQPQKVTKPLGKKSGKQKGTRGAGSFTNLEKVFWPAEGYTKGDVIRFYEAVHPLLLRHLKGRPLSLLRNPNGILDKGFFQKDIGDDAPPFMDTVSIPSESSNRNIRYAMCNNKSSLLYLANLGCIEFNPWHSRVSRLDRPDYLLLDLDPSEHNTFAQVVETAMAAHQVLEEAGMDSFCKTSGSTGIHICVPMRARYTYEQVRVFAELLAHRIHTLVPRFTSLERSLAKRGPNIYLDYLQNGEGQTVASAYSLRPKPGATCSAPLLWKEVRPGLRMEDFNIRTMAARISKVGDPFEGVLGKGADMAKALRKLGA